MFDFDDILTWPKPLIDFFNVNADLLRNYKGRDFEINTMAPPGRWTAVNEFKSDYQDAETQLIELTKDLSFCCYHATRLTEIELNSISSGGLKTLSSENFKERINTAVNSKSLSYETGQQIIQKADLTNRSHFLWFVCGKNSLKWESGIADFLSYWGGEAMAQGFYEDEHVLAQLSSIGKPYIIKAVINQSDFRPPRPEIFIRAFLEAWDNELQKGIDISLTKTLEFSRIEKILSMQDKEFLQLTAYNHWDRELV